MATEPVKTSSKNTETPLNNEAPKNAWRDRDLETLFVVAVFGISLLATLWMVLISVIDSDQENKFRIVPAAAVMLMVEIWLIFTLPSYGKLAFWGSVITIATYLFFAVPFISLGLLSGSFAIGIIIFIVVSLICLLFLFRQRDRFFPPAPVVKKQSRPKA